MHCISALGGRGTHFFLGDAWLAVVLDLSPPARCTQTGCCQPGVTNEGHFRVQLTDVILSRLVLSHVPLQSCGGNPTDDYGT